MQFADSDDPQATYFTAWACSLGPAAVEDYSPAIRLARQSVEKDPSDQQYQTGLGSILFRAGEFEEAKIVLEKAKAAAGNEKTSTSYIDYFLAMTEHHLGNPDAAQRHLSDANASAETELAGSPAWNRRLTLALLKAETMALIGKKIPPSDGAGENREKSVPDPKVKVIDASDGTTP